MNAKIFSRFLFLLAIALTPITVLADNGSSGSSNPPANGSSVLDLKMDHTTIKRMPSRCHLEVIYENGVVTLLSDYYEGDFILSFESYETGNRQEISSIAVGGSASIELATDEYEVTAFGKDGAVLCGYMQVY